MKRKLLVAIPILAVMAIIIVILILTRDKGTGGLELLQDSGYPVAVSENGADIQVTLDGSRTKDYVWSVKVENEDLITVSNKGEEKKGKATYVISPRVAGLSDVEFIRTGTVAGTETTAVSIVLPVLVYEEEGKLVARHAEEAYIKELNETGGSTLDYPYLLENREDGTAVITFPKGKNDWVFMDPDGIVGTDSLIGPNGEEQQRIRRIAAVSDTSSEADSGEALPDGYHWGAVLGDDGEYHLGQIKDEETDSEPDYYDTQREKYKGHSVVNADGSAETLLLAVSSSQNVTEFINVKIDIDGQILISLGEEPKK